MDVARKKWNPIYSNYRRLASKYIVYIDKKTSERSEFVRTYIYI